MAFGRALLALAAVVSLAVTGLGWQITRPIDGIRQVQALIGDEGVREAGAQRDDVNFLVVGVDSRSEDNSTIGGGNTDDIPGARSDVTMLIHIPADRSRLVGVSFPRDLAITRPECESWDPATGDYEGWTVNSEYGVKLNTAYALGGPKCLTRVVQVLSGIQVTHFVGLDFAGFEKVVDNIGGIEVCTPHPLVDGILGPILPEPGTHHVDGKKALDYVRARHVQVEGNGDYGRIQRQQRFLSAMLTKALRPDMILDPGRMTGFVSSFSDAAFGDGIDTQSLITLGESLQSLDSKRVTFITTPTAGADEQFNEIPRMDDIRAIFDAIIHNLPLPGEAPTTAPDTPQEPPKPVSGTAEDPASVLVQVSNATGKAGLATNVSNLLATRGFAIHNTTNHSGGSARTIVRYSAGNQNAALTVASSIPNATLQEVAGLDTIVDVVLGDDFDGTVTEPAAVGSPVSADPSTRGPDEAHELPEDMSVVNAGDIDCG